MKRIISLILCLAMLATMLSGCAKNNSESKSDNSASLKQSATTIQPIVKLVDDPTVPVNAIDWNQEVKFTGMSDETLLPYIEDTVYRQLITDINTTEYFIEDVTAVYVSQEYLREVAYNSQTNVFFGYSLADLDEYFQGTRYVFTLGDDGQTTIEQLQVVEDTTYEQMLKNVAIGTGVILVCVTVSTVTAGASAAPAVNLIFAVASKTGANCALSGTLISGVSSAVVKGYQTGDFREALKAGALGASEGFKWGAISGSLTGAVGETIGLLKATKNGLTMNQAALIQQESGYPLNVIKQFHNVDEYNVFKSAGLQPQMVNGKLALVRTDIDLNQVDEYAMTNLQRMLKGKPPLDSTGKAFELHHIGQKNNGTIAILTSSEHDNAALHGFVSESEVDRAAFKQIREYFWKAMATILSGGA